MKSRLEINKSLRWKQRLKYSLFGSVVILPSLYFMAGSLSSVPGTFAWFTSERSTNHSIQNATTSDLLRITASNVVYENKCRVENNINIVNISNLDTNVFVGIGKHWTSKQLHPGESFLTDSNDIDNSPNCNATSIQYRIKAFNNYVNETLSVAIDKDKLKDKDKEKDNSNQTDIAKQSNIDPQENKNNTDQTDKPSLKQNEEEQNVNSK